LRFDNQSQSKSAIREMNNIIYGRKMFKFGQVCEEIDAKNCLELASAKTCKTCIENHFLDQTRGLCIKFPQPRIENCLIYL